MSVSEIHEKPAAGHRKAGSIMDRAIDFVMRSWFASARGRFVLAACCLTFLTYLLLSEDPWWLFRAFPKETVRTLKHGVVDKVYHFVAYFGTTCILMWYAVSGTRRTMYLLAAAVTVHAVVTEFLQQFVPRRTTDMDDLFANLAGIGAGVCVGLQLRRMLAGRGASAAASNSERETWSAPEPGVSTRRAVRQVMNAVPIAKPHPVPGNARPAVVSADRTSFERLQLSSDQIAEVQPRQLNYRLLGIVAGVVGLMLVSTYAVHGWQVRRVAGSSLQNARQAKEAGEIVVALGFFEQYCSSAPNDVNALAEFAILSDDARTRPNGGKGVFMLFERVLRKDQTRDDIRRRLVVTAIELGRYSDALSHVKVLQQTYPKEGLFDFQAGVCQEKLGNHIAAAEAFQAAIDDSPEMIEPWERLAWLQHAESGKTEAAEQLMLRLVQVNSQQPEAWIARAKFRVRTKQPDAAGLDIDRALEIAPSEFQVLHAAGEVGIARARQARADDRLPKASRIAIETETLLTREDQSKDNQRKLDLQRVILVAEFGDVEKAFALAAKLLEDSATDGRIEIHRLMAEIAIDHGHFDQARASLDQLPRTEITDGQRLRLEASIAMSDLKWQAAADSLEGARRILAESPEQLQKVDLKLAECFGRIGQIEDRLVAYRRVLKYAPQSVEARRGLASTLATAKRYPEALAEYRQLVHIPAVRLELVRHLIDYNATVPEVARDWKEVTELLTAAKADGDSSLDVTMLSAEVLILKHEFDEARRLVSQIHDELPGDSDVLALQIQIAELSGDAQEASRLKGETLASSGQVQAAERQLRNTLLESEENSEAAISLMKLYLRNARTEQAVEVFRQHAPKMTPLQLSRTYEAFGDLQRAVGGLQQHVDQQPDDTAAVQQLAELYLRNGRPELAEPLLERMLSSESNATEESVRAARRSLATILSQKQNYRDFQRATALMDQNAAGQPTIETRDVRVMARVLRHSPKPADHLVAIGLLEKIDDRRQMNDDDHWQLGKLYIQVGLPEQAGPQFDRAARDGFCDPAFLSDLILHQIQTGALLEAREQIEHLPATVLPAEVVRLRSRYLMAIGQVPVAVQELDAFIDSSMNSGTKADRLLLGAATCREALLLDASVNEVALSQAVDRYLRAAVEADSKHVEHLVRWLLERRRDVEAFGWLSAVWQELPAESAANLSLEMLHAGTNRSRLELVEQYLVPRSHERAASLELKRCLADVWSLGEKYSEAEELYREILRVDSRHVPALKSLAWNLAMRGRLLDEAMTFAERAIAEAGPVPQLLDTRGCVKLAQSRLRAADDDLLAAAGSGNSPTTFLHLAFVQAETGNRKQARQTLAHAFEAGLRPERLHPLDRDMLERLNVQLQSEEVAAERTSVDL
jgi:tetratricopeptide (TPR) repeat protein/VanZ family protein